MESLPLSNSSIHLASPHPSQVSFSVSQNSWQLARCCAIQSSALLPHSLATLFRAKERNHNERSSGGTDSRNTNRSDRAVLLCGDWTSPLGCIRCSHAVRGISC